MVKCYQEKDPETIFEVAKKQGGGRPIKKKQKKEINSFNKCKVLH